MRLGVVLVSTGSHVYIARTPALRERLLAIEASPIAEWPAQEKGITNERTLTAIDALSEFAAYADRYFKYAKKCAEYTHRTKRDNGNMCLRTDGWGLDSAGAVSRGSSARPVAAFTHTDIRLYSTDYTTVQWNFDPSSAFTVIAGVAGSGKTTHLIKLYSMYPDACIITPGRGMRDYLR